MSGGESQGHFFTCSLININFRENWTHYGHPLPSLAKETCPRLQIWGDENRGVWSSLQLDILPHTDFLNLDFFPRNFRPLPFFNIWHYSHQPWYYRKSDIASPFIFFHVIFFPVAMIFPFPLHNLIFFLNRLDTKWWTNTFLKVAKNDCFSGATVPKVLCVWSRLKFIKFRRSGFFRWYLIRFHKIAN